MMHSKLAFLLLLSAIALAACNKEPAPTGAATTSAETAAKPVEVPKDDLPAGDNAGEVQTEEDFEEEAAKAIDDKNLKDQVDAIEKELDADK